MLTEKRQLALPLGILFFILVVVFYCEFTDNNNNSDENYMSTETLAKTAENIEEPIAIAGIKLANEHNLIKNPFSLAHELKHDRAKQEKPVGNEKKAAQKLAIKADKKMEKLPTLPEVTEISWQLNGIIESEQGRMIIVQQKRQSLLVKENDCLAGWNIKQIGDNYALLEKDGNYKKLNLAGTESNGGV